MKQKKKRVLLEHPVWRKMPIICIVVGVLSVILFIIGGTVGSITVWIEQWRFLLYVFLVYFLFLVFLFIFSVEHKKQTASRKTVTTIHISLVWTLLMFFVLFFLF
ncbi:MAG TPA: hypothetical protein VK111_11030 [Virgibacillus sp.]|nr:hypothetical protein [Virgibacillus sp.]